uniref:Gypsy retrotransposon integrase-like protein 1 n=1 Tax=Knipowitschia caucasica TaxID=637954 RepID=A0AAV2IY46_KNICA
MELLAAQNEHRGPTQQQGALWPPTPPPSAHTNPFLTPADTNPNSANWSYEHIVKEVDAAYGPQSEHAAAVGIELRQRVRKQGETMHTLRDDIYEKVAIVYGDRTELEQDCIAVEIFTNAMTDADIIQKLLEEKPRTLACAYDIAHRYETTKRAARAVTQMMRPGLGPRGSAARAAVVLEDAPASECDQPRLSALLDSGARRNVLPLHHFNSLPTQSRPPVQPSIAKVLQGIGPEGLSILGEVVLPVFVGSRTTDVDFIMADTARSTEVILGHPFLRQSNACLDYGRREISLFNVKVPRYDPNYQPAAAHVVRIARTTVLEPGREYVVPGSASLRSQTGGDLMLSPTKAFIEKHCVLVAHAVVQPLKSAGIPIRVFNPGSTPVTLKRGTVAGVLQPADHRAAEVVATLESAPTLPPSKPGPINSVSVPSHLQVMYGESCSILSEGDCNKLAHLLHSYADIFSTGPTDLGRTNIVQHDIQTLPGPPVKQPPRRMATDKQLAADQQLQQSLDAGQVLVGVVGPNPELPLVGVGDLNSCDTVYPSVHSVNETQQTLFQGWTVEQLTTAQKTDPDIAPVWQWVDSGCSRPPWSTIAPYSPATKAYWSQWKRLYMKDGVLMRKFFSSEGQTFFPQVLLPHALRKAVMEQMHDGPVGGHFGGERTLARVKTRYFWYNMRDDVTLWCRTCTRCAAKARPKKTPQAAMGTVRVGAPMERIAVDLMGPLNETDRHNRFILVVQDYFSKWVEAYPVSNEQALTVAEKIVSEWGMCELLGIEKTRTTPFHPQSDGQVERFNATLQKTLAATAEREITEPIDLVVGLPPNDTNSSLKPDYVVNLREQLERSHQLAREALGKASERAKRQYDKNICQTQYLVGSAVWYLVKGTKRVRHKVRKFLPSYEGPYFIVGQLDDLVYQIQKGPRKAQTFPFQSPARQQLGFPEKRHTNTTGGVSPCV